MEQITVFQARQNIYKGGYVLFPERFRRDCFIACGLMDSAGKKHPKAQRLWEVVNELEFEQHRIFSLFIECAGSLTS
jgi:hypothetical protein